VSMTPARRSPAPLVVQYDAMFKRIITSHKLRARVALIVTITLLIPFAVFFTANQLPLRGRRADTAGFLFGKAVSWETFQDERRWVQRQAEQQLGDQSGQLVSLLTTQWTWEKLMLEEEAHRARLRVDDQELAAFLRNVPVFQDHGVFRPERYHAYLRTIGLTPQAFEPLLRRDLLVEKLVNSIKASVRVSDDDVKTANQQAHEALKASVILVTPEPFVSATDAAATDADVRARYDASPDEVRVPEQVVAEYAGRSREALREAVHLEEGAVDSYYRDHPGEFAKEDGTPKPLGEVEAAIRDQLIEGQVRRQLTALALDLDEDVAARRPFEEILKTRTLTQVSIGPIAVDQAATLPPPQPTLLRAAAELKEGEMSRVLETDEGVYVARLTLRIPQHLPPFDEVRDKVRERLAQERAKANARASADTLHATLKDRWAAGVRFEEAVLAAGVTPMSVAFTRTGPIGPIGRAPEVNTAAFNLPLGALTAVIEVPRGFVIVRPEERIPADEATLTKSHEAAREETLKARQAARVQEWLTAVRTRAKLQRVDEAKGN